MSERPRRKLIEVALPLEAISVEAGRRKRKPPAGYPTLIHKWWAQRPIAACRAVLFATLVDDPSSDPDRFPTPLAVTRERARLHEMIAQLIRWEHSTDDGVLADAWTEIVRSTGGSPPPVLDPFCGGGSIPLEAQRLGLRSEASDLNPVAVLITKGLTEIPQRFANRPPIHADTRQGVGGTGSWNGAAGLAADVRSYGNWIRSEAERRIGHLFPKVRLPSAHGGGEATVAAWIWARTVDCPNPACGARMILARSFELSKKKGKKAWVEPAVDPGARTVRFSVHTGAGEIPGAPKTGRGSAFRCLVCGQVAPSEHIKSEGRAGRMGSQLMAVVVDGPRGRAYLSPTDADTTLAGSAEPGTAPSQELADDPRALWTVNYGLKHFSDLFTARQLTVATTFSDLIGEIHERIVSDAAAAGVPNDGVPLDSGGSGSLAYADAVVTYLSFAMSRLLDYGNSLCGWLAKDDAMGHLFTRQAIPMAWDFAEGNPFGKSSAGWLEAIRNTADPLDHLVPLAPAAAELKDATQQHWTPGAYVVATDPPYYDNIGYADLSDFFYVWLRRTLGGVWPNLLSTLLTPKTAELVATPYRFDGDKKAAEQHFESGMTLAFRAMADAAHDDFPITVFYAFKESEEDVGGIASTGWETLLAGLITSGLQIIATWPLRTEAITRMTGIGFNALISSIVLVCRPREVGAGITTRRDFLSRLDTELPATLRDLQQGSIAAVDLAQAAIGPGMAVFSSYAKVLETDGSQMSVRTALGLINSALDGILEEQENDFDQDTRWAVAWYVEHGFAAGNSGDAILLATAKGTSLDGLNRAGIIDARGGKVRLKRREELTPDWDPTTDQRVPVWEATQQLIRRLAEGGESSASDLAGRLGGLADTAKELAYRLFVVCDREKRPEEAIAYNSLVVAWPDLVRGAEQARSPGRGQASLGLE